LQEKAIKKGYRGRKTPTKKRRKRDLLLKNRGVRKEKPLELRKYDFPKRGWGEDMRGRRAQ